MKMPRKLLQFDPTQPRKSFDEAELDRLGDDQVARGTLVPLLVAPPNPSTGISIVLDGERRVRAGDKKGIKEYPVIVIDKPLSDKERLGIQLATAFHRADLTAYEKCMAASQLLACNVGWQQKDLCKFLNITDGQGTRILSPSKTTIQWQEALKAGTVTISDIYAASKLPESEQAGLLALKLTGASRDELERAGQKKRNGQDNGGKPPERSGRVKIPLSVATKEVSARGTVTIASHPGEEIDLEEAEKLLKEALRSVREAQSKGWGLKAAQAAWRDVAKKGEKQKEDGNGQSAPGQ